MQPVIPLRHTAPETVSFGQLLRRHRTTRGYSQERLALEAEISTRHLSCLETGRATPSKAMVLLLGSALELALRDRNALLAAAGFVAAYRDVPLAAPEAATLRGAIDLVLTGLEPNGAVACDRTWNLLQMNRAAQGLVAAFIDVAVAPPEVMQNLLIALLHPAGLRPAIVNFQEVAAHSLERAHREALRFGDAPDVERVRAAIAQLPELPSRHTVVGGEGPFLPVHLRRGALEVRLFTMISTIGTPIDATAEDLRIETYFPADEPSARFLREVSARG